MSHETSSSIRFISDSIRGSDIADRLGLANVSVHNKGDLVSNRAEASHRYSKSIVLLDGQTDPGSSIGDHINQMLSQLEPVMPAFERLRTACSLELWVKISFDQSQLGFDIDPTTLRRLADSGVELVFDIYGG